MVVLASNCRIAGSALTYRLLARTSQQIGMPIAVVSGNPYWRKLAREHGLTTFSSTGALERARKRSALAFADSLVDALFSAISVSFSKQGWAILAILLVVASAVAYFTVPVLKVTIKTPVEEIRQDIVAKVDASVGTMDVTSGIVPGRVMEHRFTVSDTVSTVGEKKVGKEKAKGEVTIINSSSSLVMIPAGTILSTSDGKKFATSTNAAVGAFLSVGTAVPTVAPTASATAGAGAQAGTMVKVPVVAMDAGVNGNVPALAISRFESDSFKGLTAFNEQALAGGTDAPTKVATAEDRSRLKEALFQKAQSQALSELQVRVRQSESLIPHSMQVRIEREDYDKAVDEEADKLQATFSIVATAIAFANADLNTMVEKQWKASVPPGFRATTSGLAISPPEVTQAGSQTAMLKVRVSGKAERVVEADNLSETLRGMSVPDARTALIRAGNLSVVGVDLWPGWASKAYRVEVQTVQ